MRLTEQWDLSGYEQGPVFGTYECVTSPHGSTRSATFLDHLMTYPPGLISLYLPYNRNV